MVHSWSRAPDQIKLYPDRDPLAQLLPARRLCLFFLYDCLKESLNTAISHDVVGSKHKARRQDRKVMWDKFIKTSYVLLARTVKILRWRAIWIKEWTEHLFKVLRKCNSKFDCLVYEMLYIKDIKPSLNTRAESICTKLFR